MNTQPTPKQPTPQAEPPIESASATTDHAANKGGAFAYVITAICLGVLVLLSTSLGGCLGTIAENAIYGYSYYDSFGNDYGNGFDYDDEYGYGDEWLDWLDEQHSSTPTDDTGRTLTQAAAAETLREVCVENLNDYVSAVNYAGAPTSVRAYVKNLCSRDASASADTTSLLSTAAGALTAGDAKAAEKDLAAARKEAQQAAQDAQTLAKPNDTSDSALLDDLNQAADYVSDRWTAVAEAIKTVEGSQTLSSRFARDAEDATEDLLYDGAACLLSALALSAQQS